MKLQVDAFDLAQRFVGIREVAGAVHNPQIVAMLRLDGADIADDETPWCSAFANYIAWLLRLPRSHSLAARSWLGVGLVVTPSNASVGFDVVILDRPPNPASGHVGFFAGYDNTTVRILGGNPGNAVSIIGFPRSRILGVRRLA